MAANLHSADLVPNGKLLLAQMRPALLRYFLRKTGSAPEAEDLTQDVLLRSLVHARWKSLEEAKGYLFRCAVNRWRERHRRNQRHLLAWDERAETSLGCENPPERILIGREELTQILEALDQMNERTRTVLVLVNVEHMKVAAVAEMLGISVRAVSKHLAKGVGILLRRRKRQEWMR
jgi:RNA polymerase sigma-70 factor (ECF subfamily)